MPRNTRSTKGNTNNVMTKKGSKVGKQATKATGKQIQKIPVTEEETAYEQLLRKV